MNVCHLYRFEVNFVRIYRLSYTVEQLNLNAIQVKIMFNFEKEKKRKHMTDDL